MLSHGEPLTCNRLSVLGANLCVRVCVCVTQVSSPVCVCAPETELWLTLQSASTASIESQIQGALAERILGATVPMAFPTKQLETRMKTHRT